MFRRKPILQSNKQKANTAIQQAESQNNNRKQLSYTKAYDKEKRLHKIQFVSWFK